MRSWVIQNPLVRRNILSILEAFQALHVTNEHQKSIDFFCDRETGEIFYTAPDSSQLTTLTLLLDIDQSKVSWKAKDDLSQKAELHLQEMAEILKKAFPEIERLEQLAHLHWQLPLELEEQNSILKEAWVDINRDEAEKLLLKQPIGTFLFRRDYFAKALQEILKRALKESIQCYTLTYLDFEKIVRDRTVVFVHHQWMFYDDDPTLSGPTWDSITDLLSSMGPLTKLRVASLPLSQE